MEKSICTFLFVLELVGPVYANEIKMNCKLGGDKFGKTVHFKKMIILCSRIKHTPDLTESGHVYFVGSSNDKTLLSLLL